MGQFVSLILRQNGTSSWRRNSLSRKSRMLAKIEIFNPPTLGKPLGQYSHVTRVSHATETVYIAGQGGIGRDGKILGAGDFDAQADQTFANIEAALKSANLDWSNVALFTTYLVHSQDIPRLMAWRTRNFPRLFPSGTYPPNTLLMIDRLVSEALLLEVQCIAAR
jgi:enamine deaminase RidA (YjgF/YER057c/UK114 family)